MRLMCRPAFSALISPFLKAGSSWDKTYRNFREGVKTIEQLEEENKRLVVANKEMMATNQTLRGLEAENNHLRDALEYRKRAVFKLLPARVVSRDASRLGHTTEIIIDRGAVDGLKEAGRPSRADRGGAGRENDSGGRSHRHGRAHFR